MSTIWQLQVDWRRFGNWTESIYRIVFENGSYTGDYNNGVPFKADDTVTGETSGASGIIFGYHKTSGDWSLGTAAGYLDIAEKSGDFSNGENLVASGPDAAVADYTSDSQAAMGDYNAITSRVIEATWFVGQKKPYQDVADNSVLTLDNGDQYFGEFFCPRKEHMCWKTARPSSSRPRSNPPPAPPRPGVRSANGTIDS